MEIILLPTAEEHLQYWKTNNQKTILKRISKLIRAIQVNPYSGIGKSEPLKHNLSGKWSRRIDQKNRIMYQIENEIVYL